MNHANISVGKTYVGKSGLMRKVTRCKITGADSQGYLGDIEYIPIDRKGKQGKPKVCEVSTFAKWALAENV
jgi:hypothetical protein